MLVLWTIVEKFAFYYEFMVYIAISHGEHLL